MVSSLEKIFRARSVAVVGASEKKGSIGRAIMENLLSSFKGSIYPVNIKYDKVFNLKCYKSVKDIPGQVDLAVIAVPAEAVLSVIKDCGEKEVKGAIVISAGFRESGKEGAELEEKLVSLAREHEVKIIGPNCLGVYSAHSGLDTIFNPSDRQAKPEPGPIAFVSQSGALGAALLDWIAATNIGMSHFISYGNAADVDETELIEFLAEDPETKVIACYIEGVRRGREFLKAIKKASAKKPVVVLKAGKTTRGAAAVASHTGSMAGSYKVYEGALKQHGAIVVEDLKSLLNASKALALQPPAKGPRVGIVTNGGGAGVLMADELESKGLEIPSLSPSTVAELEKVLPSSASTANPVDILGDAPAERYRDAVNLVLKDPNVDVVVVITLMQSPALNPKTLKDYLKRIVSETDKPIVMVAPGGSYTEKHSSEIEVEAGIPIYKTPEDAAVAVKALVDYGAIQQQISSSKQE
ncbi:MAG: CoA-binding protein [Thermoprotei archaeon]|nr:MAG: CoA-binding protein [Thermoprotei archaeon]